MDNVLSPMQNSFCACICRVLEVFLFHVPNEHMSQSYHATFMSTVEAVKIPIHFLATLINSCKKIEALTKSALPQ